MMNLFREFNLNGYALVIWSTNYNECSGGSTCLHYLAHLVRCYGWEDTYVYANRLPEWSCAKVLSVKSNIWSQLNIDKTYVLYPEIIGKNILGAKHVGRWYLNRPGVMGGGCEQWTDHDDVWSFSEYVDVGLELRSLAGKRLSTLLTRRLMFSDSDKTAKSERKGRTAYSIRKGRINYSNEYIQDSWICIDGYELRGGLRFLKKIFSEVDTFVSFDGVTYLNTLARLSGCKSIVIDSRFSDASTWRQETGNHAGIGFGLAEVEYSELTGAEMEMNVLRNEINNRKSVLAFMSYIHKRLGGEVELDLGRLEDIGCINMSEYAVITCENNIHRSKPLPFNKISINRSRWDDIIGSKFWMLYSIAKTYLKAAIRRRKKVG